MRNKQRDDSSSESCDDEERVTPIAIAIPIIDPELQVQQEIGNVVRTTDTAISDDDEAQHHCQQRIQQEISDDDEALALSLAAREQGIADIRHHCQRHMTQNPDSSYVTWIATLHPENAQVSVDPRFLIAGNPWLVAYEETWEGIQKGRRRKYPVVSATISPCPNPSAPPLHNDNDQERESTKSKGLLDLIIGSALILTSVMSSVAIEICAAYAYLSYWICYKIERRCSPPGLLSWLPLLIVFIIGRCFLIIDIILLFVSVIIVESIAAISYVVCTIFACSHDIGKNMHQTTRKASHLTRWIFRRHFEDWNPPRAHFTRLQNDERSLK